MASLPEIFGLQVIQTRIEALNSALEQETKAGMDCLAFHLGVSNETNSTSRLVSYFFLFATAAGRAREGRWWCVCSIEHHGDPAADLLQRWFLVE